MCWKCKNNIEIETISRTSECPVCHADLHSCKNCKFYSPDCHFDCRENIDENIVDKERANFCDAFMVKREFNGADGINSPADDKKAAAKSAFDALFGI